MKPAITKVDNSILKIIISFYLIIDATARCSQTQWELEKDKNGIKVYTAKNGFSKYKLVKVEAVLTGTLENLVTIITDVDNTKNWVYGAKRSYLLKKTTPTDLIYYNETSLPWPLSNRDVIIRMQLNPDVKNNSLKVTEVAVPDAGTTNKGIVRIRYLTANWDIQSEKENQLKISYEVSIDAGGSLPAAVTNMFIAKGPYETFKKLGEMLKNRGK
jgi:hypothetical protein